MPSSARSSRATMVRTANFRPICDTASAIRMGSCTSGASGFCVSIRQKPHARVQRSPNTMNVAVPSFQHSDKFGQPASSHTVTNERSRNVFLRFRTSSPCLTCGRIQSGLRSDNGMESSTPARARRPSMRTGCPGPSPREKAERSSGVCFHATSWRSISPPPHFSAA